MGISDLLEEVENPAYRTAVTARVLLGKAILLLDEHADADVAAAQALQDDQLLNREPLAPVAAQRVADLEEQIEDAKTAFRFVSIGRRAWADLVASNPPSPADLKADARSDINPRTFPAAAVAASCVDPEMTVEEAARLEAALNDSQWSLLWDACLKANLGGVTTPKSLVAGSILRTNERSGSSAGNTASLAAFSSDG